MTHREKMNWLKENDPITYYEMTSNPTGSNSDSNSTEFIIILLITLVIGIFILI